MFFAKIQDFPGSASQAHQFPPIYSRCPIFWYQTLQDCSALSWCILGETRSKNALRPKNGSLEGSTASGKCHRYQVIGIIRSGSLSPIHWYADHDGGMSTEGTRVKRVNFATLKKAIYFFAKAGSIIFKRIFWANLCHSSSQLPPHLDQRVAY
jgi:hypothetical protein